MAYEKKEGDISLFKNDKGGVESRPDYSGIGLLDGKEVRVVFWIRETRDTKRKYMSGHIAFSPVSEPAAEPEPEELSDEIPF